MNGYELKDDKMNDQSWQFFAHPKFVQQKLSLHLYSTVNMRKLFVEIVKISHLRKSRSTKTNCYSNVIMDMNTAAPTSLAAVCYFKDGCELQHDGKSCETLSLQYYNILYINITKGEKYYVITVIANLMS